MLVMKNAEDIRHNDIITKTKTTLQVLVSGVKNLFRPGIDSTEKELSPAGLNNHLKSPDEIEAEFRFLSVSQTEQNDIVPTEAEDNKTLLSEKPEFHFKMNVVNEILPEYMEENY
jgi:hypothetical protein